MDRVDGTDLDLPMDLATLHALADIRSLLSEHLEKVDHGISNLLP